MPEKKLITVHTTVSAPVANVWEYWTEPTHIMQWNNASDDWHTPRATVDLQKEGTFLSRMEAKDGSAGFDFGGTFTEVIPRKKLDYTIGDGRTVSVAFEAQGDTTLVTETFEAESENSLEMQRQGWQAILENFKKYAESQV